MTVWIVILVAAVGLTWFLTHQQDRPTGAVLPGLTGSNNPSVGRGPNPHRLPEVVRSLPRDGPPRLMTGARNDSWSGQPERLPDGFTMTKPEGIQTHVAVCETWTNLNGWELRLILDGHDVPTTTVVRSADDMRALVEQWRATMLDKGWS